MYNIYIYTCIYVYISIIHESDLTSVSLSQSDVRNVPSITHDYKVLTHATLQTYII